VNSLRRHFHPSVALFAANLASGEPIKYGGDPLTDFTLPKFLDRFVFRYINFLFPHIGTVY
jgi:ribosome biogenesis protein MAK21